MKHKHFLILSLASVFVVASCTPTGVLPSSSSQPLQDASFEGIDTFFAPTTKVMIELSMNTSTLKQINEFGNDKSRRDTYHKVAAEIEVTPLNQPTQTFNFPIVGIRMKGNTSRTDFVEEDGLIRDFVHFKLDFKSDANEGYAPNDYFFGMTQLDMKWNRNLDHTQIRQLYGHKMYKDFIPLMPDATLGGLTIVQTDQSNPLLAETYLGLYTLIEPMNRRLMVRNFGDNPESNGNLYKTTYTSTPRHNYHKIYVYNLVLRSICYETHSLLFEDHFF
jgi:hypothetical protein